MNLVLIGYRGTGKSSVAQVVGRALGRDVVSLDAEIIRAAGCAIPEIVQVHGWPYFRDLEEQVCREFAAKDGLVLDCGGGVVEREANFAVLRRNALVFWLKAATATIAARIGGDSQRPSLTGGKSFIEEIEEVLARRTPLYERLAHFAVATDQRSPEEISREIVARFQQGGAS